jgi:hypothetical protein
MDVQMAKAPLLICSYFGASQARVSKDTVLEKIEKHYYMQGNGRIFTGRMSKMLCVRRFVLMVEVRCVVCSYNAGLFCKSVPAIIKIAKKTAALENKTKGNNYAFNISKKLPSLRLNRIDAGY